VKETALGTLNLNQTAVGGVPEEEENFEYDPIGNWTRYRKVEDGSESLNQSRVSNRDNQMTQIDGSSSGIAYDRSGNATKLPPDVSGDWAKYYQLTWDAWNRLVAVKDESDVSVATYEYDGLYRRTLKTLGDETHNYFYNDQWKCVEERIEGAPSSTSSSSSSSDPSSSSSIVSSSSSEPPSSSSGWLSSSSLFSMSSSSSIPSSSSSSSWWSSSSSSGGSVSSSSSHDYGDASIQYLWGGRPNHRDELVRRDRDTTGNGVLNEKLYCAMEYFNPTSIIDTSGNVVERYRFSAFGIRSIMEDDWVAQSSSSYNFEFGFQGQFEDAETGYYDYGFRYYMPDTGRWASRDPIEEEGGMNLYGFVGNGPIVRVDRYGLEFKTGVFDINRYSVSDAKTAGTRAAVESTAYFEAQNPKHTPEGSSLEKPGKTREFGGVICKYSCPTDDEEFILVSGLAVGQVFSTISSSVTLSLPECPDHWTKVADFHSQPAGNLTPSGLDLDNGCPGCLGAATGSGTGATVNYEGLDISEPQNFKFDPSTKPKYPYIKEGQKLSAKCPCCTPTDCPSK